MKVVVVAGGTGGHFYPGLAVARELLNTGHQVQFIIREGDYAETLLKREALTFFKIKAGGLHRSISVKNIFLPLVLFLGFYRSFQILKREKPNKLLLMGGYLSVPPALAGKFLGIPVILHEQNAFPGLANRFLSYFCQYIATSFPLKKAHFSKPTVLTGNPVREEFRFPPNENGENNADKLTILIFGGSLGAHGINVLIMSMLEFLTLSKEKITFLHITGNKDEEYVREGYKRHNISAEVYGYSHEMPKMLARADLVICRAGAGTISELIVMERPAILIPYPYATNDHQYENALVLKEIGAAEVIRESDLNGEKLAGWLDKTLADSTGLDEMKKAFKKLMLDPLNAAKKIAKLLTEELS